MPERDMHIVWATLTMPLPTRLDSIYLTALSQIGEPTFQNVNFKKILESPCRDSSWHVK